MKQMRNKISAPVSKPVSPLDHYREDITRCVKCGACRAVCPPFLSKREESFSPRGRMALVQAVRDGRLAVSSLFEDRLETCSSCLACEAACASKVPVSGIIQAAKEEAVKELGTGFVKMIIGRVLRNDRAMRACAWLAPLALHYSAQSLKGGTGSKCGPQARITQASKDKSRRQKKARSRGSVVFFPGCAIDYFQTDLGASTVNVLDRLGFDTIVPEGLKCCGRPFLSLGDRAAAEQNAAHNIRIFSGMNPAAVVTACASCSLTFKKEYPKLLGPGAEIPPLLDIHEFLARELDAAKLLTIKKSVTWHDPCHLNRGQGLAKTARNLLGIMPGLSVIEMKNADACCGFGGVMRATHLEISNAIAAEKVRSIIGTGASSVITGCPGCRMQIADALKRAGSDVEVIHTVQLIEEALRSAE